MGATQAPLIIMSLDLHAVTLPRAAAYGPPCTAGNPRGCPNSSDAEGGAFVRLRHVLLLWLCTLHQLCTMRGRRPGAWPSSCRQCAARPTSMSGNGLIHVTGAQTLTRGEDRTLAPIYLNADDQQNSRDAGAASALS